MNIKQYSIDKKLEIFMKIIRYIENQIENNTNVDIFEYNFRFGFNSKNNRTKKTRILRILFDDQNYFLNYIVDYFKYSHSCRGRVTITHCVDGIRFNWGFQYGKW